MRQDIQYTREAFLHPVNLIFLIVGLLVVFFITGPETYWDEALLIFLLAAELFYLGTVPNMERFRRAVRARKAAEARKPPSQQELLRQLSRPAQRRYFRLKKLREAIAQNYQRMHPTSQGLFEHHLKKIDELLEVFLNLLLLQERHERFLSAVTEDRLVQAIAELREDMADDPPRVQAIKKRRLDVLERRLRRIKKAQENLEILEAQLATIEDVIQYIHEQSLTMRHPEELSFQLDTLLSEAEETEQIVQELEDVFRQPADALETWEASSSEEEMPRPSERQRE